MGKVLCPSEAGEDTALILVNHTVSYVSPLTIVEARLICHGQSFMRLWALTEESTVHQPQADNQGRGRVDGLLAVLLLLLHDVIVHVITVTPIDTVCNGREGGWGDPHPRHSRGLHRREV